MGLGGGEEHSGDLDLGGCKDLNVHKLRKEGPGMTKEEESLVGEGREGEEVWEAGEVRGWCERKALTSHSVF